MLDNALVHLSDTVIKGRVLFKESGYIGVNDGSGWVYYPPHRVSEIQSKQEQ